MHAFNDVSFQFGADQDGLFTTHTQDIDQTFLDRLREKRNDSAHGPIGDWMHVASVPAIFVHKWLREDGFNAYQAPIKDVEARLRREGLEGFLATEKRAY